MIERETQPLAEGMAQASDALRAVLKNENLALADMLVVGQALLILHDVEPPYPPRPEPAEAMALGKGVRLAVMGLQRSARQAQSPAQIMHIAHVMRELRPLRRPA